MPAETGSRCRWCGIQVEIADRLCPRCGLPVSGAEAPSGSCPGCGTASFEDEHYCAACGCALGAAGAPTPGPAGGAERRTRLSALQAKPGESCQACRGELSEGERFCANCGSPRGASTGSHDSSAARAAAEAQEAWDRVMSQLRAATAGQYEIIRELGRGGMAGVFLAYEPALNWKVAIKVISPALLTNPIAIERFGQEARTMAKLKHRNIVGIHAVRDTPLHYFVMQFIPGRTLEQVLRDGGPMPLAAVQTVLHQVASALDYAHRKQVVHRDIKPSNIMLDDEGHAIVTDFGIAKAAEAAGRSTNSPIGTVQFMSPEQISGGEITGRSDQYSLGVVAFELLSGRLPFTGGPSQVMLAHLHEPPPSLRATNPDCPQEVADTVTRMLAKNPQDRWPTTVEAVAALGGGPLQEDDPVQRYLRAVATRQPLPPVELIPRRPSGATSGSLPGPSSLSDSEASSPRPERPVWAKRGFRTAGIAVALAVVAILGYLTIASRSESGGQEVRIASETGPDLPPPTPRPPPPPQPPPPPPSGNQGGVGGEVSIQRLGLELRTGGAPIHAGDTVGVDLTAYDARGRTVPAGNADVSTDNRSVAYVLQRGGSLQLVAAAPGKTRLQASSSGVSAVREVEVGYPAVARLEFNPERLTLTEGDTATIRPRLLDRWGRETSGKLTWRSENDDLAGVSDGGLVTARRRTEGVRIIARSENGLTSEVRLAIRAAPGPVDHRQAVSRLASSFAELIENRRLAQLRDYRAEPGTREEWDEGFRALLRSDRFVAIKLTGPPRVTVEAESDARADLEFELTYRDDVINQPHRERIPIVIRFLRISDQWSFRGYSLLKAPPS